jgi:tetratricopeptide (TPR) repeat protein
VNKLHQEAEDLLERGGNATDARQAIVFFERARDIWRQCGEKAEEGKALLELARRYPELKDVAKSLEASQDAAKIFKKLGRRQLQAMAIFLTASTYGFYDKSERALKFAEESLAIAREIGDKGIIELSLGVLQSVHGQLGRVEVVQDNWDAAIGHAKGQLAAAKELRALGKPLPQYGEADALLFLGIAYLKRKKPAEALAFLSEGLELSRATNDRQHQAKMMDMIGQTLASLGDRSKAIEYTLLSLEIFHSLNDPTAAHVLKHLERLERAD